MTVVDNYFPFDTGSGATATPARWRLMARLWYGSGVVPLYLNALRPSLAGSVVTIQTGGVWIDGYYGESDSPKTVGVSGNGMVVARMDPTARQIAFYFVANQTVPTQNLNGIYEVPIMQVTGATGKDIRQFSAPTPTGPIHARACRVAAYTTSTTQTTYGWDTISWGTGFAGGIFTCPINADYLVTTQCGFATTGANQWYNLIICKNGVGVTWNGTPDSTVANAAYMAQATDIIPCVVGDTLSVQHHCSTTGLAGYVGAGNAYMTVRALP
jgi:hypothetical protein